MTVLLHRNNKFVTVHNKFPINLTANLIALRNSCLKISCCPSHFILTFLYEGTAVAQWLRCCATNQNVAGSIPAGVIGIFH